MKKLLLSFVVILFTAQASAEVHDNKKIETIHSPDTRECTFLRLEGVSQADAVLPNNPWFSLSFGHHAYEQIFSMLLATKMSDQPLRVVTTGNLVCGHAEISHIVII